MQTLQDEPLTTNEELAITVEQAIADQKEIVEILVAARDKLDVETPD